MLPSFDRTWRGNEPGKPRILILVVKDRLKQLDEPFLYIAVERIEKCDEPLSSLVLKYHVIDRHDTSFSSGGFFSANYCALSNRISLTGGAVFLDPPYIQGQRVGTYLMNEVISWARQWPAAMISPISLSESQANPENKDRRNRFYEQFGIEFDYADPECLAGLSRSMPAGDLVNVSTWTENIEEVAVPRFLSQLIDDNHQRSMDIRALKGANGDLRVEIDRAEASPWLWAASFWFRKHFGRLIVIIMLSLAGAGAYLQYVKHGL